MCKQPLDKIYVNFPITDLVRIINEKFEIFFIF